MSGSPARLVRLVAIALAGAVSLYFLAAGFILQRAAVGILTVGPLAEALGREARPEDPLALGYRGDPREALGIAFEMVAIETELGPAPAWFVAGEEGAQLAAVYVHGIAGSREDGYRHLSVLAAEGVPTLLVTYRNDEGAPASPEGRYAFGLREWTDVQAAVVFLAGRGHDRVLLVGESMGGGIVGQFLRWSEHASSVVAVALDSPALDFARVLRHLATGRGLPLPGGVARVALVMIAVSSPIDMREAVVLDEVARFEGPVFLAHGDGDRIVPSDVSDSLLEKRRGVTVALRTRADHLQSWAAGPEAYREAFAAFLSLVPR